MLPVTFVECTRIIQLHMGGREETPSHDRRSFSHLLWFPPPKTRYGQYLDRSD